MASSKVPKPQIEASPVPDDEKRVTTPKGEAPKPQIETTPAQEPQKEQAERSDSVSEQPTAQDAPHEAEAAPQSVRGRAGQLGREATGWVSRFFPGHEHAVIGGVLGLVVAVMVYNLGFWRTLFVVLLVTAGVAVGQCLDGDPKIVNAVKRAFSEITKHES